MWLVVLWRQLGGRPVIAGNSNKRVIFGNQSMILAMSCISILGSLVWGHHMYTVGMESDTRAYFTAVTMMISLPTGTKIFNWLCTYLNNAPLLYIRTSHALFALIFLLMFTIGGSTGVILGNAIVDIPLHDTYYVVAHFHFVLSLGAVIAIFSGIMFHVTKSHPKPRTTIEPYDAILVPCDLVPCFFASTRTWLGIAS